MAKIAAKKVVTAFVIVLLVINLVFTCWNLISQYKSEQLYYYPVTRYISDTDELYAVADLLKEDEKLLKHAFVFDYEGDDFDFLYTVTAMYAKQYFGDYVDFFSPKKCDAFISGYILVNYDVVDKEPSSHTFTSWSGVEFEVKGHYIAYEATSDLRIGDEKSDYYEKFTGIYDRSLLTIEAYSDSPDNTRYCLKYDGVKIMNIYSSVPMSDAIESLFINNLNVIMP